MKFLFGLTRAELATIIVCGATWGAILVDACTPSDRIESSRDVLICIERATAERLLAERYDAGRDTGGEHD